MTNSPSEQLELPLKLDQRLCPDANGHHRAFVRKAFAHNFGLALSTPDDEEGAACETIEDFIRLIEDIDDIVRVDVWANTSRLCPVNPRGRSGDPARFYIGHVTILIERSADANAQTETIIDYANVPHSPIKLGTWLRLNDIFQF